MFGSSEVLHASNISIRFLGNSIGTQSSSSTVHSSIFCSVAALHCFCAQRASAAFFSVGKKMPGETTPGT
jgi:hypothetical protein